MFKLKFSTDNAAFADNGVHEVANILKEVAEKIEQGYTAFTVSDSNGNKVGKCELVIGE